MANLREIDGGMQDSFENPSLTAVHAKYIETVNTTWQDLFYGFDELYAITYSVGMKQVERVMEKFRMGEVIIGSPSQIHKLPAEIFARQQYDIGYFCRNISLQEKVAQGTFRLYVTTGSHAKLYLLKADDGRRRVIMPSANFSACAWNGSQIEDYAYFDEPELYDYFYELFESLKRDSSDEIGIDAKEIREDGENIDNLPIVKRIIQAKSAIVIHDVPDSTEIEYIIQMMENTKKWGECLNKAGVAANKENVLTIDPKKVTKMKQAMKKEHNEKTKRMIMNPDLLIDYRQKSVVFAGHNLDLNPEDEMVKKDINTILKYMDGTNDFTGDTSELRAAYWKIMIYMFCTPFIARLRYSYKDIAPDNSVGRPFPMYMVLRGPKNGGKSSIIKTIQCLMFGKPLAKLPTNVVSPKFFESQYLLRVKGCPLLIDDITNNRFKYMKDIVKKEDILLNAGVIDHGCFILTTNEAEKVDADVAKRVIVFNIRSQLTDDVAAKRDRSLHRIQKQMGNALYRKYLARMIPRVEQLVELIENDSTNNPEWTPDIFKLSSQTLVDTFTEYDIPMPPELQLYEWKDFMGEVIKADKAINIIRQAYAIEPELFTIKRDKDLILMDLSKVNLNPKDIESLKNELPVDAAHICVGSTLPIQLSAMVEYAGINFQKDDSLLAKLYNLFRGN